MNGGPTSAAEGNGRAPSRARLVASAPARAWLLAGVLTTRLTGPLRRPFRRRARLLPVPEPAPVADYIAWAPPDFSLLPTRTGAAKFRHAVRTFVVIAVVGGLFVGAGLALLVPGARTIAAGYDYTALDLRGGLSQLSQRTVVYDSAGNQMGVLGSEDREAVDLEEVPQVVINAVVAVEDQTFWENNGIDVGGVFRALVENVTSGEIEQGGSTISQQLVKNRVLGSERDLDRKVRELVLAYRLNEQYTKAEILEEYLNTVYFGQGSYGIKSAAERFFRFVDPATGQERGKRLDELNVADAALLAGVISNPESDNPFTDPERALDRRADVLKLEVEQGYVTQADADFANVTPLPTLRPPSELRPQNYLVEEVQRRLLQDERLGATPEERQDALLRGGLRVYSTIDPVAQFQAQTAVNETLPSGRPPSFTASLVAVEPSTGFVRAIVGGPGFEQSQYNLATYAPGQQVGSSWKVITLAAALDAGYSPNDTVNGSSPCAMPGRPSEVTRNAEGGGGTQTLRRATSGSVNCAFVRLSLAVGLENVIDVAHRLGIKQDTLEPFLTLTLGVFGATTLEMASVGATIANQGVYQDPTVIERVESPNGEIVIDNRLRAGDQAISAAAANCEIDILRGVVTGGTGTGARIDPHLAVGKTGTTDKRADAFFLGMTPQLVAAVWYGDPLQDTPGAGFGGQTPASIWREFMGTYLEDEPVVQWPAPSLNCVARGHRITELGRDEREAPRPTAAPPTLPPAPEAPPEFVPIPPAPPPVISLP